jgi:hypothetical protein
LGIFSGRPRHPGNYWSEKLAVASDAVLALLFGRLEFHVDGNLHRNLRLKLHWRPILLRKLNILLLLLHFVGNQIQLFS